VSKLPNINHVKHYTAFEVYLKTLNQVIPTKHITENRSGNVTFLAVQVRLGTSAA